MNRLVVIIRVLSLLLALTPSACLEGDANPYEQVLGSGGTDSSLPALRSGAVSGTAINQGEECATSNAIPVQLNLRNDSVDDLLVYWVDYSCVENTAGTLLSGASTSLSSYEGHPWRFRRLSTNELLFEYVATTSGTQNIVLP